MIYLIPSNSSQNIATVQASNYQKTKARLLEIRDPDAESDYDDWGATNPTDYAWDFSLKILQELEKLMPSSFPLGFASLNSEGGIELVWKNHEFNNEIRLSVPSRQELDMSLYLRKNSYGESQLLSRPSIKQLAETLQFLDQRL